ncbi:MAG: conjugal transfer protein TraI [Chitinophagaceae bacterium]|nr:MAG: conjugal transfer protein TraI [Chitinophagaceae bacterium]
MKKVVVMLVLCLGLTIAPTQKSHAIVWVVVTKALKAAIRAMDLAVQRLQNKTIWLQNAQKQLENTLSKLKLDEISEWTEKHRQQYAQYFDELKRVKEAISGYKRVKEIIEKQVRIVEEYKAAFGLFRQDRHFTPKEIEYMERVYSGIMNESIKNLDQLFLVINAFNTEMTDGKRLEIINGVADHIDENLNDLRQFNKENATLSIQRARDEMEVIRLKALYGIK